MNIHRAKTLSLLCCAVALSGCAGSGYQQVPVGQSYPAPVQAYPASSPSNAHSVGTIESIQMRQGADTGIGTGAVVGGVVGGLLGNQVGGGNGKKAATVAGVIGGAMIGHQMERNTGARDTYQIGVRLDNGGYQTIMQGNIADLQVGSRVRVENQQVYRYW